MAMSEAMSTRVGSKMSVLALVAGVGIALGGVAYYMSTMPVASPPASQGVDASRRGGATHAKKDEAVAKAEAKKETAAGVAAGGSKKEERGNGSLEPALLGKWDYPESIWDAAREGRLARLKQMVEANGDVKNMRDSFGMTPVHWAAGGGLHGKAELAGKADHVGVLRYLKEKGADMKALDNNGESAVHHAARWGQIECITFLVKECGLDSKAKAKDGNTPFDCALRGIEYRTEYVDGPQVAKGLGEKMPGVASESASGSGAAASSSAASAASSSKAPSVSGSASLAGPPLPSPGKGGKKKKNKKHGKH